MTPPKIVCQVYHQIDHQMVRSVEVDFSDWLAGLAATTAPAVGLATRSAALGTALACVVS